MKIFMAPFMYREVYRDYLSISSILGRPENTDMKAFEM